LVGNGIAFKNFLKFVDIRVKICLSELTEEQMKGVKGFCDQYMICHSADTVELRKHFGDFLDEVMLDLYIL
jgi:hypothetical protein